MAGCGTSGDSPRAVASADSTPSARTLPAPEPAAPDSLAELPEDVIVLMVDLQEGPACCEAHAIARVRNDRVLPVPTGWNEPGRSYTVYVSGARWDSIAIDAANGSCGAWGILAGGDEEARTPPEYARASRSFALASNVQRRQLPYTEEPRPTPEDTALIRWAAGLDSAAGLQIRSVLSGAAFLRSRTIVALTTGAFHEAPEEDQAEPGLEEEPGDGFQAPDITLLVHSAGSGTRPTEFAVRDYLDPRRFALLPLDVLGDSVPELFLDHHDYPNTAYHGMFTRVAGHWNRAFYEFSPCF